MASVVSTLSWVTLRPGALTEVKAAISASVKKAVFVYEMPAICALLSACTALVVSCEIPPVPNAFI